MYINELLKKRNLSKYQLAKKTGLPYSTVCDICNGVAKISLCSVETIYKIAKELHISVEHLLMRDSVTRYDFELFKSNVCHRLKRQGDVEFVYDTLASDDIRFYFGTKWYPEALYLLALVDYISRVQSMPLCSKYDDFRQCCLSEKLYPADVLIASSVMDNDQIKQDALLHAIPEFMQYNIIECEVRDVA
jgi:transcriptional regulator with XRE-family HTH domain